MSDSRNLEEACWEVFDSVDGVDDALDRANARLKALDLLVKIRSAGEKVKPPDLNGTVDDAVSKARRHVNGSVRT